MFDDLISTWSALRIASREMVDSAPPPWPWDRASGAYTANQRRRDAVQGRGMAFAFHWRLHEDAITAMVMADAGRYPEFHVTPMKGEAPDPKTYMASVVIMPRLIEGLRG